MSRDRGKTSFLRIEPAPWHWFDFARGQSVATKWYGPLPPLRLVAVNIYSSFDIKRIMYKVLAPFILCVHMVACGSSSTSSNTTPTGGPCTSNAACAGGVCATSQDFPSGYCTIGCQLADPSGCPSGSVCIDDASGVPVDSGISAVCYQTCQNNSDCARAGYACLEKANHLVCRNGA